MVLGDKIKIYVRMLSYTNDQLIKRDMIIQTHKQFTTFLNANIINRLVHLFKDGASNTNSEKISNLLKDILIYRNIDISNIVIKGEVYGEDKTNSTLYLGIKKNNMEFLHLTIHLGPKNLNAAHHGVIHFYKDIYQTLLLNQYNLKPRTVRKIFGKYLYTLITVNTSLDKPNSLEFSIDDEQFMPPGIENVTQYQSELQTYMDAILDVLNTIFYEKSISFVGKKEGMANIHNQTNIILANMNTRTKHATRKNWGVLLGPSLTNSPPIAINRSKHKASSKKRGNTRKLVKIRSNAQSRPQKNTA
jgi:hypothetical protein